MSSENFTIVAIFPTIVYLLGALSGYAIGKYIMENRAIETRVGYYDSKTGEFKFVEIKE